MTLRSLRNGLVVALFIGGAALAARAAAPGDDSTAAVPKGEAVAKFTYDIWGDAVNVAARIESSGEAGRIALSESTYHRVKDQFECEHRGPIEVKNKGLLDTYFLVRIKP